MPRKPAVREVKQPERRNPKREINDLNNKVEKSEKKKKSPAKKVVVKKAQNGKKISHPPYDSMIKRAIKQNDGAATSVQYIGKYIQEKYKLPDTYKRYLKAALKRMESSRLVYKVRASYKLYAKALKRKSRRSRSKSPARKAEKESPRKKKEKEAPANKEKQKKERSSKKAEKEEAPKKRKERTSTKESSKKKEAAPKKARAKKPEGAAEEGPASVVVGGSKYDHFWQYDENGHWKNYDTVASDTVEEVYQKYAANRGDTDVRAVKSGQWEYQVDFAAMKQMNIQHPNHTVRSIRRVPNASSNA